MTDTNRNYLTYKCNAGHKIAHEGAPTWICPVCGDKLTRTTRTAFGPASQKLIDAYRRTRELKHKRTRREAAKETK